MEKKNPHLIVGHANINDVGINDLSDREDSFQPHIFNRTPVYCEDTQEDRRQGVAEAACSVRRIRTTWDLCTCPKLNCMHVLYERFVQNTAGRTYTCCSMQ